MMKFRELKKYFSIFVLAVLIIAVYKTFDNIGAIFSGIGSFISMLSPIFIAFVIAFLLYPMCQKTEVFIGRHFPPFFAKRSRGLSVLAVYLFMIFVVGGVLYMLLPTIIQSLIEFIKMIPHFIETLVNALNESPYINIKLSEIDRYIDFQQFLQESGWLSVDVYTSKLMDLSAGLVNVFLSVITSIYILIDRKSLASLAGKVTALFASKKKLDFVMVYVRRGVEFSYKYLFCVIMDAIIVFVLSLAIMSVMRIRYASVLALMMGLFNVVPYFGAIVAGVISVLITMITADFSAGIILAVALLALQQIDANVIQPQLVNESLDVKPFWVLVGILIGGYLFGIWGIIIAVPLMALMRTIINDYFEYRNSKPNYKSNSENK